VIVDLEGLDVFDSNGVDITNEFINTTSQYYALRDYKSIQDLIINQDLSVSHEVVTDIKDLKNKGSELNALNFNKGLELNALTFTRTDHVSKRFYHIATDTKGKFTKDWVVTLSGSFSYNTSTYNVTSVTGPRISLTTANFGAMFSPALENVLTSNSRSGRTARFSANYTMRATFGLSVGDLPIGFKYNFGTFTDTFSANPSVLQ
jgi:hypothetical protein